MRFTGLDFLDGGKQLVVPHFQMIEVAVVFVAVIGAASAAVLVVVVVVVLLLVDTAKARFGAGQRTFAAARANAKGHRAPA